MTQFGYHSDSNSAARRRIDAAGEAYKTRKLAVPSPTKPDPTEDQVRIKIQAAYAHGFKDGVVVGNRAIDVAAALGEKPLITMKEILYEVASKYGVSPIDICSERRTKKYTRPRQEVMYRCAKETKRSLPSIGRFLGDRDHTTVLWGIRQHENRLRLAAEEKT